jgi:hypothetical protein
MGSMSSVVVGAVVLTVMVGLAAAAGRADSAEPAPAADSRLGVLWTSGDPEVAYRVCFMYTHNAKKQGWFDHVRLIVWGPSSRLLAADKDVQAAVKQMMADGVEVQACIACANSYGVADRIRELGIEVKAMGSPLTQMLKEDWKVLTF